MNAKSELVWPRNFSLGLVVETRRMFHWAWPASHKPAFNPTRGSGLGAAIVREPDCMAPPPVVAAGCVHAAASETAVASDAARHAPGLLNTDVNIMSYSWSLREGGWGYDGRWIWMLRTTDSRGSRRRNTQRDQGEHALHARDFGGLIDMDVVRELEHEFVLRGAVVRQQVLDHRHGALVVLDHVLQKQFVELRSASGVELLELIVA